MALPRWKKRAKALLDCVRDAAPPGHPPPGRDKGTFRDHHALFDRYVKELKKSKEEADDWWNGIVKMARKRGATQEEAEDFAREQNPVGKGAHGRVIATVRKYWLEADELNRKLDEKQRVAPEDFVLGWLMDDANQELAELVSDLPYWPLGLTEDGRWS